MGFGGLSGQFPFQFGGGPTPAVSAYVFLRDAVGATEADTIVEDWRMSRARALASIGSFDEAAVAQGFPHLATDFIPEYEDLLGIRPAPDATEQERRDQVVLRYTLSFAATAPAVQQTLTEIDPRLSRLRFSDELSMTTIPGRAFEDHEGTEPFGTGRKETGYPHHSDRSVIAVLFDADPSNPTVRDRTRLTEDVLDQVLPGHVRFHVAYHPSRSKQPPRSTSYARPTASTTRRSRTVR